MDKIIEIDEQYKKWISEVSKRFRQSQIKAMVKSFSETNLRYMQKFAELYSEISNLPQVGEDFGNGEVETIFAIPWGHHKLIIDKCNGNRRKALFFVYQVLQNGWSRAVLLNFLDTDLFEMRLPQSHWL